MGSFVSSLLAIRAVDMGAPILAMHSAVETMGAKRSRESVQANACIFFVEIFVNRSCFQKNHII